MSQYDIREILRATAASATTGPMVRPAASRGPIPAAEGVAGLQVRQSYSPVVLAGLVRLLDLLVIAVAGILVHAFYLADEGSLRAPYAVATAGIATMTVIVLQGLGAYTLTAFRTVFLYGLRIAAGWTIVILVALGVAFFAKLGAELSRVWLAGLYVLGGTMLIGQRIVLSAVVTRLTRTGRFDRLTAIVGGGEAGEAVIRALEAQPDTGLRIVGVFDDRTDERSPDIVAGHPKVGNVDDLVAFARNTKLDLVIFTMPISAEGRILQMLKKLWILPIDIRLSAHSSKLRLRPRSYSYVGTVPVLDVFDKPIADWDLVLKWLFDKIVAAVLVVHVSPILIATAIAVKLDSKGPVLFRQKRYGFNNELIEVFKFRSMYVDQADIGAAKLVTRDDPRVTRVGRFIRKTSIDELPQLFNVLFGGKLSLVGPRPHALQAKAANQLYDQVVDGYFARHKVKPGITGWAQVNGWRGETDTQEKIQRRVEFDLYYIENWSVFFDLYIVAITPFALMSTDNAY